MYSLYDNHVGSIFPYTPVQGAGSSFFNDYIPVQGATSSSSEPYEPVVEYFVSKTGSDTLNDGLSLGSPFATILKATQTAEIASLPGTTINIGAGVWKETADSSYSGVDAGVGALFSGTVSQPYIFQATPGDEGLVVIDGEYLRCGFAAYQKDYIHIKNLRFVNNNLAGIASANTGTNKDFKSLSSTLQNRGWLVEGCYIFKTNSNNTGSNPSGIRADYSHEWIIRNNWIEEVTKVGSKATHCRCVLAYYSVDCLIENNFFKGATNGCAIKQHYYDSDDGADDNSGMTEWEIRYNFFTSMTSAGILMNMGTSGTTPSGDNNIHHNIFHELATAFSQNMSVVDSAYIGGVIRFENNTVYLNESVNSIGLDVNTATKIHANGNIIINAGSSRGTYLFRSETSTPMATLESSNYNCFDDDDTNHFNMRFDFGGATQWNYGTFDGWEGTTNASVLQKVINAPDEESITSNAAALWNSQADGDYTNKVGSPAIGANEGGTNMGAYETGSETIGLLSGSYGHNTIDLVAGVSVKVWYDAFFKTLNSADVSVLKNQVKNSTGYLNNSNDNLTQTTATKQPLWNSSDSDFDDHPSISYTKSDVHNLNLATFDGGELVGERNIIFVCKLDTISQVNYLIDSGTILKRSALLINVNSGDKHLVNSGAGMSVEETSTTTDTNPHIYLLKIGAGDTRLYRDGTLLLNGDSGSQNMSGFSFGRYSADQSGDFTSPEAVVFESCTDAQRNIIGNYFANKYGLTWSDI